MSRRESQFPTATFALKLFFGLLLGSCGSAAWTLHRAHLRQRAVRSYFKDTECGPHGGLPSIDISSACVGMLFGLYALPVPRRL